MTWIDLRHELPKPNELVYWYDAMFDNIMHFRLKQPETFDGDFTHFTRNKPTTRPGQYNEDYSHKEVGWYVSVMRGPDLNNINWENIPIYEHPALYRARMTMDRNRAVIRRLKKAAH